ncbi:HEAT repeat domain-containing protein [Alkalicoccus luteus]|uniref:HEAT repeat domain-containing protein n=1 Tax=Alkalicoccus luteus TaxID=1237094 RepID=A0A969TXI4_9BACI|nr:HEAT repeat domain-containing protein [Alkalicoccus luteus]NJP38259.1 HEAT repeat domain-containing protein [Alkalicoccus luteus]
MMWAVWLIVIFVVLQLVLLVYLLLMKSRALKYEKALQHHYEQVLPQMVSYASGEKQHLPEFPSGHHLKTAIIEKVLDRLATITENTGEQARLQQFAEQELLPVYKKRLRKGNWAERMNTLYFIEDLQLSQMADAVDAHINRLRPGTEEHRQAVRTLATLGHTGAVDELLREEVSGTVFRKEILRRLPEEELRHLVNRLDADNHPELYQALLVHVGERGLLEFLPDVERALSHSNMEVRLKAMKSIGAYQYMNQPELIHPFFHSEHWEERMFACKTAAVLSLENRREELLELLADREWWVRYAAAEALQSFSDGEILLEYARHNHEDRFARDMAARTLTAKAEGER